MQRYKVDKRVELKVPKVFDNPGQTLPAGSKGTIKLLFNDELRYRIQFDDRAKIAIIKDTDLKP